MRQLLSIVLVVILVLVLPQFGDASESCWITTWTSSPEWADRDPNEPLLNINGQTVRERVRLSVGGRRLRIQLSNEYGSEPLRIGAATVALPDGPASVKPASIHTLTFKGHTAVAISPGTTVLADAIDFSVPSGAQITVSIYFPEHISAATYHELGLKRAVISARDNTHAAKVEPGATSTALLSLSAVLVPARLSQRLVVMFGDSIVDGYGSTLDADRNWSNELFRRLQSTPGYSEVAVVNSGISGNRLSCSRESMTSDSPVQSSQNDTSPILLIFVLRMT